MFPLSQAVGYDRVLSECDVLSRFHTDPSGTFVRYEAKAIGSGSEAAQSELQDKWHKVLVPSYPFSFTAPDNSFPANDTKGSPNIDSARAEASDGREA